MMIEYSAATTDRHKLVTSYLDSTTLATFTGGTATRNWQDFPKYQTEIQFVPYWGAFVYAVKRYVHLKVDASYDITEDANKMMNQDPCLRGSHLFANGNDGGDLQHYRYDLGSTYNSDTNRVIAMEFAFDSLWMVFSPREAILWRLGGDPTNLKTDGTVLTLTSVFDISGTDLDPVNLSDPTGAGDFDPSKDRHLIPSTRNINSMCSLEFYGLFLGVDDNGYFIHLKPKFTDVASPGTPDKTNGLIDMTFTVKVKVAEPQTNQNTVLKDV